MFVCLHFNSLEMSLVSLPARVEVAHFCFLVVYCGLVCVFFCVRAPDNCCCIVLFLVMNFIFFCVSDASCIHAADELTTAL